MDTETGLAVDRIEVHTFGGLSLHHEGSPITIIWESQKARLLFCYLLVTFDQWVHRDKLTEALWPGCEMNAGTKNFKTTLSRLRKSFMGSHSINPVLTQGSAVRLDASVFTVDSSVFRKYAAMGIKLLARGDISGAKTYLESAQDLYSGPFLPEEPFNEMIAASSRELSELHLSMLRSLEKIYQQEGNMNALEAFSLLK